MLLSLRVTPASAARLRALAGDRAAAIDDALAALQRGDTDEASSNATVLDAGGLDALMVWHHIVGTAREENLLAYPVHVDGTWVATIEPLRAPFDPPALDADVRAPGHLSRFAYVRRDQSRTLLESPFAPVRLELGPEVTAIALDDSGSAASATVHAIRTLLHAFGFHHPLDRAEPPAERVWEFHDALFHRGSRLTAPNTGATFRYRDELPPWPAIKTHASASRIALPAPHLADRSRDEATFTDVLERRRSIRRGGATLTLTQLAELLFRTLRVGGIETTPSGETIQKVIPSGGGLHGLEAYLAVRRCEGLAAGLYWYDAAEHALCRLDASADAIDAFVEPAVRSWGRRFPPPDVLITLTARLPRIAWKYERMAYRLALLDAGAAVQTLYLVATAMRLSPCAVGNGDPDLFARVTGLNPHEETSVAEFALSGAAAP